jgi:hypothetical protein
LGFAKLLFEVSNPSLERAQVALGREVQHAGDLLTPLVHGPLDSPTETKALHDGLLNLRILHQLCNPRILEELEKAVCERSHRDDWG